ncbi:MAG: hypothetical protein A3F74_27490 [Betaproteobacteria bacterium RIFCSPLOWO2_12_FULL_62_58]|nr:MAG: hypothetical protein A3F74_27490 [Betaproteobacteria bacterium RIFCSPLOWO2_12_FULL_62_58]
MSQGYTVSDEVIRRTLAHMAVTPDYVPELKIYLAAITQTFHSKGHITTTPAWDKILSLVLGRLVPVATNPPKAASLVATGSDRVAILTVFRGLLHEICDD